MNTEQFFEGPGTSSLQTYVWEIAIILLGAFILGYLLRLMLNSKFKERIASLETEIEQLKRIKTTEPSTVHVSVPFDTTELDTKIRNQQREIDILNQRLATSGNEKNALNDNINILQLELEEPRKPAKIVAAEIEVADTETEKLENFPELAPISTEELETNEQDSAQNIAAVNEQLEANDVSIADTKEDKEEMVVVLEPQAKREAEISIVSNSILKDDLKKIEGIGPKIESLLNVAGIVTFNDLKEANPDYIREVLAAAGPNYAVHDPATWSEQATLANNGNWDALTRLQEVLKGGKRKK